jgi:hypothetical protein
MFFLGRNCKSSEAWASLHTKVILNQGPVCQNGARRALSILLLVCKQKVIIFKEKSRVYTRVKSSGNPKANRDRGQSSLWGTGVDG